MARPSRLYLLAYNSLQSLGWSLALFRLLACLAPPVSLHPAYALASDLICHPVLSLCSDYHKTLSTMADLPQVHCFYPVVSNRGRTRRNVDYLPGSSICEGEGPLLRLLCKVLHELPFISRGWAAVLSASVAEAVPACVQAAQVQAGKGAQEETGMRNISSARQKFRERADCWPILQLS